MGRRARAAAAEGSRHSLPWLVHTRTEDGERGVLRVVGRTPEEAMAALPADHAPVVAIEPAGR